MNAFGVFQTYYTSAESSWTESPSNVSWIGSTQAFLLLLVGVISGPVYDAGYFRYLITTGAVLIPLGFMMTSLSHKYWQTMLAQAICIGLGNGCIFVPSVAILPQYFSTRKALANGLAASGSSIGGVIYPIVFRQLQQRIGFAWATRVLGFISLVTIWFSVFVMKPRIKPKGKRKLWDWSALKEIPYLLFCFGMFFGFIGFYGPVYVSVSHPHQFCPSETDIPFSTIDRGFRRPLSTTYVAPQALSASVLLNLPCWVGQLIRMYSLTSLAGQRIREPLRSQICETLDRSSCCFGGLPS